MVDREGNETVSDSQFLDYRLLVCPRIRVAERSVRLRSIARDETSRMRPFERAMAVQDAVRIRGGILAIISYLNEYVS